MWDATAQVTLLRLEGKNGERGVCGEVGRKSRPVIQNCARETRTIRLFQFETESKILPEVPTVISYVAGFGLLEKLKQYLKFSERCHLFSEQQVR